jgi:hypothetical protein
MSKREEMKRGYKFGWFVGDESKDEGMIRGYYRDEGCLLHVVLIEVVRGWPVDYMGEEYRFNGEVDMLVGWPDDAVAWIDERLGVGLVKGD